MIPLIHVQEHSLAEAWVKSIKEVIARGISIPTEYNEESPSLDCCAAIRVDDISREPRIPRFIPCGLDGLVEYALEVAFGTKDNLVGTSDTAWTYTYHQRLFDYQGVNQISYILDKLTEAPYTRRAIAVTWNPLTDIGEEHPACLQNVAVRVLDCGDFLSLEMCIHIRSNDALMAAYMNMYAFGFLQWMLALELSNRLGRKVLAGSYTHFANSYHIYGSRREDGSVQRFLQMSANPYLVHDDVDEILYEAVVQQYEKYAEAIDGSIFASVFHQHCLGIC